ncbi:6,7-dimethyl-8-ribityllumazine synthase [Luteithermobacter gelatinilyticus]|uniref:6,7-dimethyl-8-ribityllumazine synthase n=1 Tax=Luteithermobacter gelatinilyticus TaxID=2582913 RepID=UPI00110637D9|nr:6,7-dimethyl-8-ribityllumazine synthase [Luteithermobacter gelatinilyticus]|tara:strand:- start:9193 stop:9633 length:441 start_codon:yes stop_codon:yes gene_type:complete
MSEKLKLLIVEARFYEDLADELVKGAMAALDAAGAEYDRISVPGAFEIPAAIRFAADSGQYDGFVGLGVVIRGETTHYDYVCGESARGLQDLAIRDRLAIGYGILTVENREQAWARAAVDRGNKGAAATEAALRMIELKQQYGLSR